MTIRSSLVPDNVEPGNLLVSQASLVATGEIEIAGRRYITKKRLAAMLGNTVRTLSRWEARRIGPSKISIGKTVLYDLVDRI